MNSEVARWLISKSGQEAAAALRGLDTAQTALAKRLRKEFDAPRAAALLDQEAGRRTLTPKHRRAATLFTTRRAAEQASSEKVAAWRARRFSEGRVLDLCCGIGIDTEALARRGPVVAVDAAAALLELARANQIESSGALDFVASRIPPFPAHADFAFCDPDRRRDGQRQRDPEQGSPRLSELLAAGQGLQGLGVKLSPACDLGSLESQLEVQLQVPFELEFVSHRQELKEIVLWTGSLAGVRRRVSVPEREFTASDAEALVWPEAESPGAWLLDPDPALSRAMKPGVVPAHGDAAFKILPGAGGYATADEAVEHPLFKSWRIDEVLAPDPATIRAFLNARGVGRIDLARRGVDLDLAAFKKRLKVKGSPSEGRQLFFFRLNGRLSCVVCFLRNTH